MADRVSPLPARISYSTHSQTLHPSDLTRRLVDILVSALGLFLLAPVFLWVAWRICRDSPGPVFYWGPRLGQGGKPFSILKFRTMRADNAADGPRLTAQDDPRITPFGKWLRDTKINELPQLWNVFVGDMSLVGPRPEDPDLANEWPVEVRNEILSIRPGITSPASVQFRNEEGLLSSSILMEMYVDSILPSKLRLDQLYVRHRSLWLDLDTLFWTALLLLPQGKKYAPPDTLLFQGPIFRIFRRYLNWFTIDAVVALCSMALTGLLFRSVAPLDIGWERAILLALVFSILFSFGGLVTGVQRIFWSRASVRDTLELVPAVLLSAGAAMLINYLWPHIPIHTGLFQVRTDRLVHPAMILVATAFAFSGFVVVRYRSRLISAAATRWLSWRKSAHGASAQERVLIVGGGESGQFASWLIDHHNKNLALKVIGFVDDDLFKQGVRIHGVNVVGMRTDIPDLVVKHDVGVILFAIHNIAEAERSEILQICQKTRARVVMVPDVAASLMAAIENRPAAPIRQAATENKPTVPSRQVYS